MTSRRFLVLLPFILSGAVKAQSPNDLAAFSALVLSPEGAFAPLAVDDGRWQPEKDVVAVRYGRWRFDVDDGIHNNIGVTLTHRLGGSSTSISVTGAYLSLSCDCSVWASGGAALTSTLWSSNAGGGIHPGPAMHVNATIAAGGAWYSGDGHATAWSQSALLDVGGGIPFFRGSRIAISIIPGIGRGHLNSPDETATGVRPLLGTAASLRLRHGVAIDVGTQRVVLADGPTQFGAGLSWHWR